MKARGEKGRKRLFWRVYSHGLLLLLLAFVSSALVWALLGHSGQWRRSLSTVASLVGARCGQARVSDPEATGGSSGPGIAELSEQAGVPITCFDLQGHATEHAGIVLPAPTLAQRKQLGNGGAREALHLRHPARVVQVVRRSGASVGFVVIGAKPPHPPFERVLLWLGALLGVLALGSIPLVRAIVSPLVRMTATARSVSAGDLSARTGVSRRDELGEMARAFDEMVQRLQQLIQGERELLANVSHELRTPLARLRVALELAEEGDSAAARRHLAGMGADLQELEELVEDLLTAARLEVSASLDQGGLPALRCEPVGVAELVQRAAQRFRVRHPESAVELLVEDCTGEVEADPRLMQRVLDNLLTNAHAHGSAQRPIALRTSHRPTTACIEVVDHGSGITPEDLARVFEPFFRTERSRSRDKGGVGLGLTLCKRIVEAHGGSIEAQSAESGTVFRVTLPWVAPRSS